MCLGNLRPVMQADDKLQKMIQFAKIILILNLVSSIFRFFMGPLFSGADFIFDMICALFLWMSIMTLFYIHMAFYLFFSLYNAFYLFVNMSIMMQNYFLGSLVMDSKKIMILSFCIYLFAFYVFAMLITFPIFKEMRAQLYEQASGAQGGSGYRANNSNDEERNAPDTGTSTTQNNRGGFRAFGGRGVQVGGN
jgi:hypothetical protein